jgi:hypothetical protein
MICAIKGRTAGGSERGRAPERYRCQRRQRSESSPHPTWATATQGTMAEMKCLRVYSTADGESHFDEVEIPTTSRQVHPNAAAFEMSAKYAASGIRFTHIPAGAGEVDWHTVPERVLTVRLNGSAEYQTSDGDKRRVPAGSFVLFENVDGKGHKSLHSSEKQTVLWISLPEGLDMTPTPSGV